LQFAQSQFLQHPVFNRYHSETEMLRYIKRLESRDLSLTASMIPLGSCTMKLNAAAEMFPVSWPEFAKIHPFAPLGAGARLPDSFQHLEDWLAEITGFAGISLQPNAGSQGEYAGCSSSARITNRAATASQRLPDSRLPRTARIPPAPRWPA
jgi:glycine dehydrogenase